MYVNHLQNTLVEAKNFNSFVKKMNKIPFYEQNGQSCFLTSFVNAAAVTDAKSSLVNKLYKKTEELYVEKVNNFINTEKSLSATDTTYSYKDFFNYFVEKYFSKKKKKINEKLESHWEYEIDMLLEDDYVQKYVQKKKIDNIGKNWVKKLLFESQFNGGQASESVKQLMNLDFIKNNFDMQVLYSLSAETFNEKRKKPDILCNKELLKKHLQKSPLVTSCMNYMVTFSPEDDNVFAFKNEMATMVTGHSITCFAYVKIHEYNYFVFLDSNNRKQDVALKKCDVFPWHTTNLKKNKACVQNIFFFRDNSINS